MPWAPKQLGTTARPRQRAQTEARTITRSIDVVQFFVWLEGVVV